MRREKKCTLGILCLCAAAEAGIAGVDIQDIGSHLLAQNDALIYALNKSSGHIEYLQVNGVQMAGDRGGYNQTVTQNGYFELGGMDLGATTYSTRSGPGWVDAVITHTATAAMPFNLTQHHVLRDGETGIHIFKEISHSIVNPASYLEQMDYAFLGNTSIFNTHDVAANRTGAMPTPSSIVIGGSNEVQDATFDLQGLGSPYPERYYTKYDWATYQKDAAVIGMTGNGYGAWMIQPNRESNPGGPLKQILTVHQTQTDPALLGMDQSIHYGSKRVDTADNWSKVYGPQFLYFNTGPNAAAMRADAEQYATFQSHQDFYDSLGITGYATAAQRGGVTGKVNLPGGQSMAGAMVVLSQNGIDWQKQSRGYNYWGTANPDGTFNLANVRPGTYRVSVFKDGQFGEYTLDNVTISASSTQNIGNRNWAPTSVGTKVWQIGRPDRTAGEFRHGDSREYWLAYDYAADFPTGVNYQVESSETNQDWNWVQWRQWNSVNTSDWNVKFNLKSTGTGDAKVTVALAASQGATDLQLFINGTTVARRVTWDIPSDDQQGNAARRSGNSGFYLLNEFTFSTSLLNVGANNIAFHLTNQENILYDAIRMEIPGYTHLPGDFSGDNIVSFVDMQRLADGWMTDGGLLQGDANGDAFVNLADLLILEQYWGTNPGNPSIYEAMALAGLNPTLLPEPGAASATAIFAILGLKRVRSRTRRTR